MGSCTIGGWGYRVSESCSAMSDSLQSHGLYTVHGILQARILEWVAVSFSRGSSQPRDRTQVSHIPGRIFTSWATREVIVFICCVTMLKSLDLYESAPSTGRHEWLFYLNDFETHSVSTFHHFWLQGVFGSTLHVCDPGEIHSWVTTSSCLLVKPFLKRTSPGSCLKPFHRHLIWQSASTPTWKAGGLAVISAESDAPKHGV